MLSLLDSQKALWVAAGILTAVVSRLLAPEIGWWLLLIVLPLSAGIWGVLRALSEAVIRRFLSQWVREKLTPMIAAGEPQGDKTSVWKDPVSTRIARSDFRRFWIGIECEPGGVGERSC